MDFRLSERQRAVREQFDRFFSTHCGSPERLAERELGAGDRAPSGGGFQPAVWQALGITGALRLTLPKSEGGMEDSQSCALVLAELMGRYLYQSPYFDTVTAADLIHLGGPHGAHWGLLRPLGMGQKTVALVLDRAELASPERFPVKAEKAGLGGWQLSGFGKFVSFAPQADYLLVPAVVSGEVAVFLVPGRQERITARRQDDLGRGEFYAVELQGVPVSERDMIGVGAGALATALALARTRHSAYMVGLVQGALELTQAYVKERRAFGQPIARFQSVSFRLAALAARVDAARLLTHHVGWQADHSEDVRLSASQALAATGRLAREAVAEGMQMHGSFGISERSSIQRYYRRAAVDALLLGAPSELEAEAAGFLREKLRSHHCAPAPEQGSRPTAGIHQQEV